MASPADGDRGSTSGSAPKTTAPVRPKLPPPPEVGPKGPDAEPRERTVVTRAPRANGPADPREQLPTLRMDPIEARAARREVSELATRLGIGGAAKKRVDETTAASAEVEAAKVDETAAPIVEASTPPTASAVPDVEPDAPADPRETAPTLQLQAIPVLPETRERPVHPQARRPPLPLPSVLRSGPRTIGGARMPPAAGVTAPSEYSGPRPGMEPMPIVDTATLVADCTEELLELEAPSHEDEPEAPATLEPVAATPAEPVRGRTVPTVTSVRAAEASAAVTLPSDETIAGGAPQPRRWGWIAAAAAVLALAIGLARYGWSSDAKQIAPAPHSEASLSAVGDATPEASQTKVIPAPKPERAPALAMAPAPTPEPEPALVAPDPELPPVPAPPVAPTPPLEPAAPEAAAAPSDERDDVAVEVEPAAPAPAVAAPAPTAAPKPAKSSSRGSSKRKRTIAKREAPKAAPPPTKTAAAAPSPAAAGKPDAASLLRDAEAAYRSGNWSVAMRTAQKSQAMRGDGRALKIIAMAACRLRKQDTAQRAFDQLPLGMRKSVRTVCKDADVKLRL